MFSDVFGLPYGLASLLIFILQVYVYITMDMLFILQTHVVAYFKKIAAAQNEVTLSYYRERGIYVLAVIFAVTIY